MAPQNYPIVRTKPTKAYVAAAFTFLTVVGTIFADDVFDTSAIASAIAGLIGLVATVSAVYKTRNDPVR